MKIKLNEKYGNDFLTTVKGTCIKKGEIIDFDKNDKELAYYLEQGIVVVVKKDTNTITDQILLLKEENENLKKELNLLKEKPNVKTKVELEGTTKVEKPKVEKPKVETLSKDEVKKDETIDEKKLFNM